MQSLNVVLIEFDSLSYSSGGHRQTFIGPKLRRGPKHWMGSEWDDIGVEANVHRYRVSENSGAARPSLPRGHTPFCSSGARPPWRAPSPPPPPHSRV